MRFWEASAIVPLLLEEPGTALAQRWLAADPHLVTWALSLVEVTGAIERRTREAALTRDERRDLLARLKQLAEAWDEVVDLLPVRRRAAGLLARHALCAADALQIGAANEAAEGDPTSLEFVCLDKTLAEAAEKEGFAVLTWPPEA